MPQALNSSSKSGGGQGMGKIGENFGVERQKSEVRAEKVYFASLMGICHLKNAELEAKHQKYKGRVVF